MCLLDEGSLLLGLLLVHALSHELLYLLAVVLVEGHVVVADKVVTLLAVGFGGLAVAVLLPCQHALADVYAAVVHDVGLHHTVAVGLHNLCQGPAQQVVAHVSQVQGLVGVRTGVFDHYQGRLVGNGQETELGIVLYLLQQLYPLCTGNGKVQEAFHHVEFAYQVGALLCQVFAHILCSGLGRLPACLQQGEYHQCQFAFKLGTCFLQLYHLLGNLSTIEVLHSAQCRRDNLFLYAHYECLYFECKVTNK